MQEPKNSRRRGRIMRKRTHCDPVQLSDNPRVLVVDDEPHVLNGLKRILGRRFAVETASSAEQAIERLMSESYHAVITDYDMPGEDGIWLLQCVSEQAPQTKRVLHSGADPEPLMTHVKSGVVQRFVPKPASNRDLVNSIKAG